MTVRWAAERNSRRKRNRLLRFRASCGHPVVAAVIVGMRSAEEVRRDTETYGTTVPAGLEADPRGERLLDARAPLPA
ncbi:hypothetical protein [Streptomyces sp. yara]|uniref:hypothetical protein n=1 Tax=Streptomyces sp. yara TaxID=3458421 RepID=UPI00404024AF